MATHEQDLLWVYNPTRTPFTVTWGRVPYRVESGEKKIFPRFIAEHFAKHLADAILQKREQDEHQRTGKHTPFINHPEVRPKVVNMILPEVYSYFQKPEDTAADAIAHMVNQVNRGVDPTAAPTVEMDDKDVVDFGFVPNKALGNLAPPKTSNDALDAPLPAEAPAENTGELIVDESAPKPKKLDRNQLLKEAVDAGIDVPARASAEQIRDLLIAEQG